MGKERTVGSQPHNSTVNSIGPFVNPRMVEQGQADATIERSNVQSKR